MKPTVFYSIRRSQFYFLVTCIEKAGSNWKLLLSSRIKNLIYDFANLGNGDNLSLVKNYDCSLMLLIFGHNSVSKWISGITVLVNKSISTVETQNIPMLLKLIEGKNHKYNNYNSYFSL